MNLKGFKKTQDEKDFAVLKNKQGHEIKIAKRGLQPKHLKDLEGLPLYAEGGDVESGKNIRKEFETGVNREESKGVSEGGQYARQGAMSYAKSYHKESLKDLRKMPAPKMLSGTGPDGSVVETGQMPTQTVEDIGPNTQYVKSAQDTAPEDTEPQQAPADTAAVAQPAAPQEGEPNPAQPTQDELQQLNQNIDQNAEDAAWASDLNNGHITPQTYQSLFAKKDTTGKIGTLFGLLLSGAGSGLAHQPNMVMQMMDNQIRNDLEAQKTSKENAMNYYKLNLQQQLQKAQIGKTEQESKGIGAETALKNAQLKAFNNAYNQSSIAALHDLQQQINKLPPGPDRLRKQQQLNNLQGMEAQQRMQRNAQVDQETGFQQEQNKLRSMGMLGMSGGPQMAEAKAQMHVPGFGDASIPVPNDVRQELIAKHEYDKAARNYINFAQQHQSNWANLNPKERLEIARQGGVLGAELQGKYRMKTHGGVYKEGEQEYIQKIIPDNAASWQASFNQIPKVQQTIMNNQSDMENLANGYGLSAPRFHSGKYYSKMNGQTVEVK